MKQTILKSLFTVVLLLIAASNLSAQTMSVASFEAVPNDMSAMQQGTKLLDQNGDPCAIIKIQTTEKGFTYDVGSLGIVKTEEKVGEIWVYVPFGVNRITLHHPTLKAITYQIPTKIEKGRVYKMDLKVKKLANSNTLTLKYSPANAIVLIDGKMVEGKNGVVEKELSIGKHEYSIFAEGYNQIDGLAKISADEPTSVSIQLVSKNPQSQGNPSGENNTSIGENAPNPANFSYETFTVNGVSFKMAKVEGGTFTMGATSEMEISWDDDKPTHQVTLSSYYIGQTEVTQALWVAVMGKNPSKFKGDELPVEKVSWKDCQKFIEKLNSLTGKRFRLPTEAEWEFAARGGNKSKHTQYSGSSKINDVAWYEGIFNGNSAQKTHPVATKQPNELGIYDMSGNVWEWCSDKYGSKYYSSSPQTNPTGPDSGSARVNRGGSWYYNVNYCHSSGRKRNSPGYHSNDLGFRLCLSEL